MYSDLRVVRNVVAAVAILIGLITALMLTSVEINKLHTEERQREEIIQNFVELATLHLSTLSYETIKTSTDLIIGRSSITRIRIVDSFDFVVVDAGNIEGEQGTVSDSFILTDESDEYLGELNLHYKPTTYLMLVKGAVGSVLLFSVLSSILIFSAIYYYLNLYISNPIQDLIQAIDTTLTTGQHTSTLASRNSRTNTLLGKAVTKFNAMQRELESSHEAALNEQRKRLAQFHLLEEVLRSVKQSVSYYDDQGKLVSRNIGYAGNEFTTELLSKDFMDEQILCRKIVAEGGEITTDHGFAFTKNVSGSTSETLYQIGFKLPDSTYWAIWALRLPAGNYAMLCSDVTDEHEFEQRARHSQKLESLGALASGVAHDFNNVLAIIFISIDMLEISDDLTTEQHQNIVTLKSAAQQASNVVQDLVKFARQSPEISSDVRLSNVIHDVRSLVVRILGPSIELATRIESELCAKVNADSLKSAIINLVVNGRDAMPDGGRLEIVLRKANHSELQSCGLDTYKDYAAIEVNDTGIGIPREIQQKVFDPFFTTKSTGRGTGLGLSSVFGYLNQVNGTVVCDSEEGRGTTMLLYLPQADSCDETIVETIPGDARLDGVNVLVVDDEREIAGALETAVVRSGGSARIAYGVQMAMDMLQQKDQMRFDVLLCDLMLPDGRGEVIMRQAKMLNPGTVTVMFSGNVALTDDNTSKEFNQYIDLAVSKPLHLNDLLSRISSCMETARKVS